MKKKYRMFVYTLILVLCVGTFVGTIYLKKGKSKEKVRLVGNPILEEVVPVQNERPVIVKPFIDDSVSIISNYYDYQDDYDTQIKSIIYFNDTYMQNTGIIYGADHEFDIVAIYDGEVTNVYENDISGKIVEIQHNNEVMSRYHLLSDVIVSVNTKVKAGDVIGKSGISNVGDVSKNQLFFEFVLRGELLNGEKYFGKTLEEI